MGIKRDRGCRLSRTGARPRKDSGDVLGEDSGDDDDGSDVWRRRGRELGPFLRSVGSY